jgi:hypothetical protein
MVFTAGGKLGIKCGYNILMSWLSGNKGPDRLTEQRFARLAKDFEEHTREKLLEEQLDNTSCRKVKIKWTITTIDGKRFHNHPITESTDHELTGYVLGTIKDRHELLPIYEENETVKVLIKRDITDIKDIDALSEIPRESLLEAIKDWNGNGKHDLQIEAADNIKIIKTPIEDDKTGPLMESSIESTIPQVEESKKIFVKLKSGEYSLLDHDKYGYFRRKEKYTKPERGSTVIEYTDYKNNYRVKGKKKGGNRKTMKSTKKQTKKSKSYKRRTIKKH